MLLLHELQMAEAADALVELARNGHLAHWFGETSSNLEIRGLVVVAQLIGDPAISFVSTDATIQQEIKAFEATLASADDTIIEDVAAWCEYFSLYTLPYDVADTLGEYPNLLQGTLRNCADSLNERFAFFAPPILIRRWAVLQDIIGSDRLTAVIQLAVKGYKLCSHLQANGFDQSSAGLYRYVLEDTSEYPESFKAWCAEQLPLIDKEGWQREFDNADDTLRMLFWFNDNGTRILLRHMFSDALISLAKRTSTGDDTDIPDEFVVSQVPACSAHLEAHVRNEYRSKLLQIANEVEVDTVIPDVFFKMFGSDLLEGAVRSIRNEPSPVLETSRQMATQATESSLAWMLSLLEELNGKGTALADDRELCERIVGLLRSIDEDLHSYELLLGIADHLGIDASSAEREDEALGEGIPADQADGGTGPIDAEQH